MSDGDKSNQECGILLVCGGDTRLDASGVMGDEALIKPKVPISELSKHTVLISNQEQILYR